MVEKIRTEIERFYNEYKEKFRQYGGGYYLGILDGLDMAKRIIDTIERNK